MKPWVWIVLLLLVGALAADLVLRGVQRLPRAPEWSIEGANVAHGKAAIDRHGCASCHVIPGIRNARGRVGPKLEDFKRQLYIAGMLPNEPEHLILWLQDPQGVNPRSAMPNLGLTDQEARDIAAYLYSL